MIKCDQQCWPQCWKQAEGPNATFKWSHQYTSYVANLSCINHIHLVDAKQLLSLCKTGKPCKALPPAHGGDAYRQAPMAKIDPASLAANGNCFETASIWIDLNFIRHIYKLVSKDSGCHLGTSLNSEQSFKNLHSQRFKQSQC